MQVKSILNAGQKYCRMLQGGSILQYFQPSFSHHLSLRSLFSLFLGGCFTQVLLYAHTLWMKAATALASTGQPRYLKVQGNGENTSSYPKFDISKM